MSVNSSSQVLHSENKDSYSKRNENLREENAHLKDLVVKPPALIIAKNVAEQK